MSDTRLDNIFWRAFSGSQRHCSVGTDRVRRYAQGYSPIIAFADPDQANLAEIAPWCAAGERCYTDGWSGPPQPGWRIELEATMYRMIWAGTEPPRERAEDSRRLVADDASQALALAQLTRPGPFGPRTLELGEYYGCFGGARLLAMAGERLQAGDLREVSGVCTHPDGQGRGLARQLTAEVVRRELQRGQTPFLHVMCHNTVAHEFYLRFGFRDCAISPVRIIYRTI